MRFVKFGAAIAVLLGSAAYADTGGAPSKSVDRSEFMLVMPQKVQDVVKITAQSQPAARQVVSAEITGRITLMAAKSGDKVLAGQQLALFDTTDLRLALERNEAALAAAQANLDQAQSQAGRETELRGRGITSSKALEDANFELKRAEAAFMQAQLNLSQAGKDLERAVILSPISGTVVRHDIDEGERVAPGTALYTVVDGSKLDLKITLAEGDARRVRGGEGLNLWPAGAPDHVIHAQIESVDPIVDGVNRSVTAHATIDVGDSGWRAGEFLLGEVVLREEPAALILPVEALIKYGEQNFVMEIEGDKAVKTPVGDLETWKNGALVQIGSGLQAGDVVLVRPLSGVDDGTLVKLEQ